MDVGDIDALQAAGVRVRSAVLAAPLVEAVRDGYQRLEQLYGPNCDVAVRSSATAEDLPEASFAGQQETFLNIHGETMLLDAVRRCYASLFTDRAIVYRVHHGFDHTQVALSVGVQKMVRSDLASAGVMFSIDTESGFTNAVSPTDLEQLQPGDVLVTDDRSRLGARDETRRGRGHRPWRPHVPCRHRQSRAGHPAIVGTATGPSSINTGDVVTVSCAEGDEGFVYRASCRCESSARTWRICRVLAPG